MLSTEKLQEIKARFGIIGNADGLNRAISRAYKFAPTDYSLLVIGESGVGKEFFPQIVHQYSNRKHNKYLAVNCGAIPSGTIDSELFGHVKGAFTGAISDHKGYFEEADGGTLFLDEVGELPLETQVRLLRVLETGEYIRVGSSEVRKTNVRVVAATNVNLATAILQKKFRADLFHRLNIPIVVPALRERKDDIPLLFRKFAVDCTEAYHMPQIRLTEDAKIVLMNYPFPGNIRQLKNIVIQICLDASAREITASILKQYLPKEDEKAIACQDDKTFAQERELLYKTLFQLKKEIDELRQLVNTLAEGKPITALAPLPETYLSTHATSPVEEEEIQTAEEVIEEKQPTVTVPHEPQVVTMMENEKELIRQALERNNHSRKLTALELGLSERTLYRKIKNYDLQME